MPPRLSRLQQRGLVFLSALVVGGLFLFHWVFQRPWAAPPFSAAPSAPGFFVEVDGDVFRPGLYSYDRQITVGTVLGNCGGLAEKIPIPASVADRVLDREIRLSVSIAAPQTLAIRSAPLSVRSLWILGRPLPLNRATVEELDWIPGIGPGLAQRIVDHREEFGPFGTLEELQRVHGVGEKTLEKLRYHLTVP